MASFLVAYGTGEGQTRRVAERLVAVLTERGHDATAVDVAESGDGALGPAEPSATGGDSGTDDPLARFDAVLVGASIHAGKPQQAVVEFVREHRDALAARPSAYVQVSLSSATEAGRPEAAGYVEAFVEETGWHPDRIGQFGGALRYSEYGFLKRLLMKQIAKRTLPDAAAGDVEFTDWDEVEAFGADVAAFVEGRLGIAPPGADAPSTRDPTDAGTEE